MNGTRWCNACTCTRLYTKCTLTWLFKTAVRVHACRHCVHLSLYAISVLVHVCITYDCAHGCVRFTKCEYVCVCVRACMRVRMFVLLTRYPWLFRFDAVDIGPVTMSNDVTELQRNCWSPLIYFSLWEDHTIYSSLRWKITYAYSSNLWQLITWSIA